VAPSYADVRRLIRINGQPAIGLVIYKESGTSTLKVAGRVKRRLEELKKELPQDLNFKVWHDESEDIQKNLKDLYLVVGIILAVIFIMLFMILRSFKPSLLILSSIVFSVLITFNFIYLFKISMNLLTLGGLALGFGLFVDNSIVVFENVLRLREKGTPPIQAAIAGSKEVFLPVLAATLTTIECLFFLRLFSRTPTNLLSSFSHCHFFCPGSFPHGFFLPDSCFKPQITEKEKRIEEREDS